MKRKQKPKWAKPIPADVWKALHKCQGKQPTRRTLREDFAFQQEYDITCWTCRSAMNAIGELNA